MNHKIRVTLSCLGLVFLLGWGMWKAFQIQQDRLCSEISVLFTKAMEEEKALKIDVVLERYDSAKSPNKIPWTEKKEWGYQDYLFFRDSTRTFLDSLFQATLSAHRIQAKTGIRCKWKGEVFNTFPDSLFYEEALLLKQLDYRSDENPDKNIMLQAYARFSSWAVWQYGYFMWGILGLGLFLLGSLIGGYKLWRIKKRKVAEKEKRLFTDLPVQDKEIERIKLAEDLSFDEKHGSLCYQGNINVYLTGNILRLFCLFISVEQRELTYEKICVDVLARSIKSGLSKTDRNAVASAIRYLRDYLKPIPIIEIRLLTGIGYRLEIREDVKVAPDTLENP